MEFFGCLQLVLRSMGKFFDSNKNRREHPAPGFRRVGGRTPHILWNRLRVSTSFLSRYESSKLDCVESSTQLTDKLVRRELKQCFPTHHMRLFVLALAADHWVHRRIVAIAKIRSGLLLKKPCATTTTFELVGSIPLFLVVLFDCDVLRHRSLYWRAITGVSLCKQ